MAVSVYGDYNVCADAGRGLFLYSETRLHRLYRVTPIFVLNRCCERIRDVKSRATLWEIREKFLSFFLPLVFVVWRNCEKYVTKSVSTIAKLGGMYFCSGKANDKNNNMKKHNPILAAAGRLLVALVTVGTLFTACVEFETPTPDPKPKNLVINEFRYDGIPAEGGSVKPVISYSYEALEEGRYVKKTDGAVLTFDVSEPLILDDGMVTAPSNPSGKTITHQVKLTVRVNSLKTEKTVGISQYSLEGVKNVEYTLVPLELGPHEVAMRTDGHHDEEFKFISNSKDGCLVEDVPLTDDLNPGYYYTFPKGYTESVTCTGTQIPFTGGDLLTTITYYDGKVETEVEKAVFSVESSFPDATDTLYNGSCILSISIPETLPAESIVGASVADGVWTINKIVSPFTGRGVHKLIATTSRGSQSITLNQNANDIMDYYNRLDNKYKHESLLEYSGEHKDPVCGRLSWPDLEDYPEGSDPSWLRGSDKDWWTYWNFEDMRGLHPDTNRYICLNDFCASAKWWRFFTLRSGDEFRVVDVHMNGTSEFHDIFAMPINGVVMTAEADIPTAEGIKHKKLQYEWHSDKEPDYTNDFKILIPNYPEATDDFKWTVTFKYPEGKVGDWTNWEQVSHMFPDIVYTFDDFRSTSKAWSPQAEAKFKGFFIFIKKNEPIFGKSPTLILDDGVEIKWEELIKDYFPYLD